MLSQVCFYTLARNYKNSSIFRYVPTLSPPTIQNRFSLSPESAGNSRGLDWKKSGKIQNLRTKYFSGFFPKWTPYVISYITGILFFKMLISKVTVAFWISEALFGCCNQSNYKRWSNAMSSSKRSVRWPFLEVGMYIYTRRYIYIRTIYQFFF